MATRKITITLPEEQLNRIKDLVSAGHAASVSGFVQCAVATAVDDVAGWGAFLARILEESGGPLSPEETDWADEVLAGSSPADRAVA